MTKKTIKIENAEPLLLFGSNDNHLKKVEAAFPKTKITARGNQVVLEGTSVNIKRVEKVINELITVLQRNKLLTENEVDTILAIKHNGNGSAASLLAGDDVILHAPGGNVIKAKTSNQRQLVASGKTNDLVFAVGPAGTGKTYLAMAAAINALLKGEIEKIILTRPAVEAGEALGFLPGDLEEKITPYLRPLYDAIHDMLGKENAEKLMEKGVIEIAPLAFMRGRTLNDTFMILDEGQNTTITQMKMFLTRMGINSRIVVTGDATQNDLQKGTRSGLEDGIRRLSGIDGVEIVRLTGQDIVRHRLVREIVSAYEAGGSGSDAG